MVRSRDVHMSCAECSSGCFYFENTQIFWAIDVSLSIPSFLKSNRDEWTDFRLLTLSLSNDS
jgi:hypothetical protein